MNRRTEFGIKYDLSDVKAASDAELTPTAQKSFANIDLLLEDIQFYNQMTLEHNYCVLDGNQDEFDNSPDNVAYFSDEMSDENGEFNVNPTLVIEFTATHSSVGLTFRFVETYPSRMKIQWYQDSTLIYQNDYDVTELEQIIIQPVQNYNKIVVTFLKTAIPYRYIKMSFLRFGVLLHWNESNVKSAKLVQQHDIISKQLPINTLTFDIVDTKGDTNIGNSSGIQQFFQKSQAMFPYEIINGNTTPLGRYYLDTFSNEKVITKINAVSIIGLLDEVQFEDGEMYDGETAKNVIDAIMGVAGIEDYDIDATTQAQLLYGTITPTSCRNALQQVLFACGSIIDVTDVENIHIKKMSSSIIGNITKETKFTTKVTKTSYVSGVKVKYNQYSVDEQNTGRSLTKGTYPAGTHKIVYNDPHINYAIDTGTITDSSLYYVIFELEEESEIEITADSYAKVENSIQSNRAFIDAGESVNVVEVSTTLCNYATAKVLSEKLLEYYGNRLELNVKHLAIDNAMNYSHNVENIRPDMDNYIAMYTQRSLDLTGGFIDTSKMLGYFDNSAYYYYATDNENYIEYVADDNEVI